MDPKTILIVDGHTDSRAVYRAILEWAGYRVLEADRGDTAIDVAHQTRLDAIVTELLVPKLDGFQLIGALRSDPEYRMIPILVLTSDVFADTSSLSTSIPIKRLSKPYPPALLLSEIEALIRGSELPSTALGSEGWSRTSERFASPFSEEASAGDW